MSEGKIGLEEETAGLDTFTDTGVAVLPGFFNGDLLRSWWESAGELKRDGRFVSNPPDPIGSLCKDPRLVDLAESIVGTKTSVFLNRMLVKDSKWNEAVSIHQDWPYFADDQPWNKLSVFVAFGHIDMLNGGLLFVPGSHKHGLLPRGTVKTWLFPDMGEPIDPVLEAGDVVLMDLLVWHFSMKAVNRSERPLLQIVYRPVEEPLQSKLAPMIPCSIENPTDPDLG